MVIIKLSLIWTGQKFQMYVAMHRLLGIGTPLYIFQSTVIPAISSLHPSFLQSKAGITGLILPDNWDCQKEERWDLPGYVTRQQTEAPRAQTHDLSTRIAFLLDKTTWQQGPLVVIWKGKSKHSRSEWKVKKVSYQGLQETLQMLPCGGQCGQWYATFFYDSVTNTSIQVEWLGKVH